MTHRIIDHHLDGLRDVDLARLGSLLHAAWQTTRDHPSRPDGYPTTASGSDTGGRGNAEMTSVEAAAARPKVLDPYDKVVRAAMGYLADADRALRACVNRLATLDNLRDDSGLEPTVAGCWALARIGSWEPVAHTVVIDGDPRQLGTWAYRFHRSHGRLPTLDECKRRARGDKVYVRAS